MVWGALKREDDEGIQALLAVIVVFHKTRITTKHPSLFPNHLLFIASFQKTKATVTTLLQKTHGSCDPIM